MVDRRNANTLIRVGTIQTSGQRMPKYWPHIAHHSTVNHTLEFVNPTTGTHTQHVESYWGRVKKLFKSMKGVHAEQLPSYLDELMWRECYGTDPSLAFPSIFEVLVLNTQCSDLK